MKKKKLLLFCMLALSILTICFVSCSDDDREIATPAVEESHTYTAQIIEEKLLLIMNDTTGEYKDGGYIIYSAEDNELFLMSELTYSIGEMFNRFLQGETIDTTVTTESVPLKAPKGNGWKKAGTCKSNSLEVLNLSRKIASKIPKGRSFEIHAEANGDGTYTVWYRII